MIQASIIMICKFQSIYCTNNSSVISNDILRLIVAIFICTHFITKQNAFRYVQMHPDELGLNENIFGTSRDAFGRNEMHLGAVCISEVGAIVPKCISC
jgi:hypothetical protein